RLPIPGHERAHLIEEKRETPQLLSPERRPFRRQTRQLGPQVGGRGGRRGIPLRVTRQQIAVKLLGAPCRLQAFVRPERDDPFASRDRARAGRDRLEHERKLEDGVRVVEDAFLPWRFQWRRSGARIRVGNGCTSGGAGGSEVPTQEANGKPAHAGLPPVLQPRMTRYSAFIRAIIFLFAALSFRLRRSLGFSKCC